jgi:flagellar biogenesis protein FliO
MSVAASPGQSTAVTTIAADIPVMRESAQTNPAAMGAGGVVLVVAGCMLLVGVLLVARKRAGAWRVLGGFREKASPQGQGLRRLSSVRLTATHSVHVIEWQGRQLLLGCGNDQVRLLAQSPGGETTP